MVEIERTQEIVDIIHGAIAYSGIEGAVIGTPIFNRLHRILQNSMVYLTFPANKVKRFEHSIGVMHLAGKFFFHSVCNSEPEQLEKFFFEVNNALVKWNSGISAGNISYISPQDRKTYEKEKILNLRCPQCGLYAQNRPANIGDADLLGYYVVYQSLRLAGLLHDVGHLPYSHVLEYSLQALYQEVVAIPREKRHESHKYFLGVMEKYCGSSQSEFAIHEELGQQFVDKIFEGLTNDLPRCEDSTRYFLAAVLYFTRSILSAREGENGLFSDLHRVVAGTLDCDRMDYCCRDTYCAGTSKDLPSYARVFSSVRIMYHPNPPYLVYEGAPADTRARCCFMPSTKAIHEIEAFLRSRWDIYATINYHHRVHKHELLLVKALTELGLREMAEDPARPPELNNVLPLKISSIWQLVDQMKSSAPVDYFAIQLDDSWMDTLLKHKYFQNYGDTYLSFQQHGNDLLWHKLDELISVQKHYRTLFKRPGGFRQFDFDFFSAFTRGSQPELSVQDLTERYTKLLTDGGEYFFNQKLRELFPGKTERNQFFAQFDQRVRELVRQHGAEHHIADCFLADNSFSLGISLSDQLHIYSSRQRVRPFVSYSPLYNVLMSEKKLLPSVHVYFLPAYDIRHGEYETVDREKLMDAVAREAVLVMEALQSRKAPETAPALEAKKP